VLDVDVIYSRVLHELLGRAATDARLLELIWSDELVAEAERVLRDRKGVDEDVAARWVGYLVGAFPRGRTDLSTPSPDIDLSTLTRDPDDEHVCSLAVYGKAELLFTFDRGYERDALGSLGVEVMHPDRWLTDLADKEPMLSRDLIVRQAGAWGGGRPVGDLLAALERAGTPDFVAVMRAILDI